MIRPSRLTGLAVNLFLVFALGCSSSAPEPEPVAVPPESEPAPVEEALTTIARMRVDASSLNVRAEASAGAPVVAKLRKGTIVDVVGYQGDWSRIRSGETTGWAASKFLKNPDRCPKNADFRFIEAPVPSFPESGVKGVVVVDATVNVSGVVTKTSVVRNTTGDSALGEMVEREIRRARFVAPVKDCRPRPFVYTYTRTF